MDPAVKLGKGVRSTNNLPDLLRAMPGKVSIKDGEISNQTMMGKRLERFGEVMIVDETNGFGLDSVKKIESGFWSATPDVG